MALKVQDKSLTSGSSRPTIPIKAGLETQWYTLQIPITSANGGRWGRSSQLPEFKSKWLGCSLHTFLQSVLSGRILGAQGTGQPGLCRLKTHFIDCQDTRAGRVLGVMEMSNCAFSKLYLGLKIP